ncbi:MAG: class I SAM-dependent methyltransferase [Pseudomonadota bacterium]
MHSKKESLLKRWHSLRINPDKCKKKWDHQYWIDEDNCRIISCSKCPSFNSNQQQCDINFGTPLRKCVVSSIEAHFFDCKNKNVLEIGFGRFKLAKNLIQRGGGTWTGVEPRRPKNETPVIGKGGYGHATHVPFPDKTFDKVFAVQSMEHWSQKAGGVREPSSYPDCIAEINRVLKPGGTVYLDAPVHFHGNEIFIMGDVEKIRSLFHEDKWINVHIEKWRENYSPLPRYTPSQNEFNDWPIEITSYPEEKIIEARNNGVIWLLTITAEKK